MLAARRAFVPTTVFGRCSVAASALHTDITYAGSRSSAQPSCMKSARRCFGARIRRHSEKADVAAPLSKSSAELPSRALPDEVNDAIVAALAGEEAGVRHLGELALSEVERDSDVAEDALHEVLLKVSGNNCDKIRSLCEESLQRLWHQSGDAEIDEAVRRGVALMDKDHHAEAVQVFTEVIERVPSFVEAWNKRATARFFLQDLDGALEDCDHVLSLKPRHFGCLSGAGMCHQRRGDLKEAARWFRRALAVHPGLDGPRMKVKSLEAQVLINDHLRPRIITTVQALNDGSQLDANIPDGLSCTWDIWKEEAAKDDTEPGWNYFFRVRIMNQADGSRTVRSLARFYVFRFADGRMLPLTLLTEGSAGFALTPGEDYRFSWNLISTQELQRAVGGMLLKDCEVEDAESDREQDVRFLLDADLGAIAPADATKDEVERMRLGYRNAGRLDLRRMNAVQPLPSQSHK